MSVKVLSVEDIIEAAKKYIDKKCGKGITKWCYIGIRTQDVPFELGAISHRSTDMWDCYEDYEPTAEEMESLPDDWSPQKYGDELEGICVTIITGDKQTDAHEILNRHTNGYYDGKYKAILGCDEIRYGDDECEVIMIDAEVLEILA